MAPAASPSPRLQLPPTQADALRGLRSLPPPAYTSARRYPPIPLLVAADRHQPPARRAHTLHRPATAAAPAATGDHPYYFLSPLRALAAAVSRPDPAGADLSDSGGRGPPPTSTPAGSCCPRPPTASATDTQFIIARRPPASLWALLAVTRLFPFGRLPSQPADAPNRRVSSPHHLHHNQYLYP